MDKQKRMFFEAGDDDLGLQVVAFAGGQDVAFSANDEWCGSTDTGFGATVTVSLRREDAERLRDFLDVWLKTPNAPHEGPGAASSRTVPLDAVVGGDGGNDGNV